jgi:N-methylhydantoinase A/oxoprolinase/acetone carboxylase beta subunit
VAVTAAPGSWGGHRPSLAPYFRVTEATSRVTARRRALMLTTLERVQIGRAIGWRETPILGRADLATPRSGPAIVEEYDATCVIPPGARAALDEWGNIAMTIEVEGKA